MGASYRCFSMLRNLTSRRAAWYCLHMSFGEAVFVLHQRWLRAIAFAVSALALAAAVGAWGVDRAQGATVTAVAPSEVQTEPVVSTANGVLLKGSLNPGNAPTTYYFVYKDTATECEEELGCGPTTATGGPLEGYAQQEVPPLEVTGLTAGETYRYWLVAINAKGAVRGPELTFQTPVEGEPVNVQTGPVVATPPSSNIAGPLSDPATLGASLGLPNVPAPSMTSVAAGTSPGSQMPPKPTAHTKLATALAACQKKPRLKRAVCQRQARKRYATTAAKRG